MKVQRTHPYRDSSIPTRAVQWHGKQDIRVVEVGKPLVTEPRDALVRVTATTICGSDLHFYNNAVQGMVRGDIVGHEFMGIIDDVGPEVKNFKVGDRVVASFSIACGECEFCQKQAFSCCNATNPSRKCKEVLGDRLCGAYGYSHLTGGYDGGQAEFVRVPIADVNLLKVPDTVSDEKALFLSDIVCTGWHANELGRVKQGDVVAVWGAGPVGLMAMAWAKFRGASMVIAIDRIDYRLKAARKLGCVTINCDEYDVVDALRDLVPLGPDVGIDAVGFRFPKSFTQKFLFNTRLEGDALDVITEMIYGVKKNGHLAIVGDYFGLGHAFPIGPFMEKSLILKGGQTFVQKYWHELLGYIERGEFDPTFVITHHMELEDTPLAYKLMNNNQDHFIKAFLHVECDPATCASLQGMQGVGGGRSMQGRGSSLHRGGILHGMQEGSSLQGGGILHGMQGGSSLQDRSSLQGGGDILQGMQGGSSLQDRSSLQGGGDILQGGQGGSSVQGGDPLQRRSGQMGSSHE